MQTFTDVHSGYKFCMKTNDSCSDNIRKNGICEYDLIKWSEQFLTPEGTFVDIGAHTGTYSVILSKKCKNVHSFEPQKDIFQCLNISLMSNDCFNVTAYNMALGSKECVMDLNHVSKDGGGSTFGEYSHMTILEKETCRVGTLDSFNLTNVDFIKIDVEGFELEVIKGALNTLKSNNYPPFIFEAWKEDWYQKDKEILLEFVHYLGYKVILISGTDNMYLASDHEDRQRVEQPIIIEEEWEKLHALAKQHRLNSRHQEAYDYAKQALSLVPPKDKEYLLHEEISIVAYYLGIPDEGYLSCDKVIFSQAPFSTRNNTLNNQAYYMSSLPVKKSISIELPHSTLGVFKESSTSIIPIDGGFRCNVRLVNYCLTENGGYKIHDPNNTVHTRNILLTMDKNLNKDFNKGDAKELFDRTTIEHYPKYICGMEDIRLFGNNEFFCTYLEVNKENIPQICYCQYDPVSGNVTKVLPLMVGAKLQCEKNWMPFIQDDEVHFIYKINPLHICKLNRETGEISTVLEKSSDESSDFRGSSGLIPYKLGWLGTVHQVYYNDSRKYFHRFIWFNKDFSTLMLGDVFYFRSPGIEYNLSICHSEDGLLVPYSEKDNSSKIAVVDYKIIDEYLFNK